MGDGGEAEQPGHPGGQHNIGQCHHPELRVGEGHPLSGLALEFLAVDLHEVILQSVLDVVVWGFLSRLGPLAAGSLSLRLGLVSGPYGPSLALASVHPRCSQRLSASRSTVPPCLREAQSSRRSCLL